MKIFTSVVFPRALPLLLGESTFSVPPPIPKTVQKRPFASYIYIEKGRLFGLLFASFFRLWKNVRAKSEAFRRVPQSSSFGSLCDLLILSPLCCSALSGSVTRVANNVLFYF